MTLPTRSLAVAAALLLAAPAFAGSTPPPAPAPAAAPPPVTVVPADGMTGTKATSRFAWGGIGLYGLSVSCGGFGSCGITDFGLNVGAAMNVLPITPDLQLAIWGDVALGLGSSTFFPLSAGAGVRFDKLPVQLFGGLALELVAGSYGSSSFGGELMVMGLYPLPQVDPHLSGEAKFSYSILSNSLSLWTFTVGAGYGF